MRSPTPDHPFCHLCGRRLKTREARRRGFGPICWPRWLAESKDLEPGDPRLIQAAITQPLFPDFEV
jgi:hypothetical protein